jgi:hypothetical protein
VFVIVVVEIVWIIESLCFLAFALSSAMDCCGYDGE